MRHLIACQGCNRQYDVSKAEIGSRMRCHCGDTLEVQTQQCEDAAVVRCSACGGARQEGATACTFCGADFTLHELDLQTICPYCMARISNRAKFCHRCGVSISAQPSIGAPTDKGCPVCGAEHKLSHRTLGAVQINALECSQCAGLWLGNEAFRFLAERARADAEEDFDMPGSASRPPQSNTTAQPQRGPMYRPCVDCSRLMTRTNYGRASGVIIDVCKEHGVWFDAHELNAALDWIRSGGLHKRSEKRGPSVPVDPLAAARAVDAAKEAKTARRPEQSPPASPLFATVETSSRGDVLTKLFQLILRVK